MRRHTHRERQRELFGGDPPEPCETRRGAEADAVRETAEADADGEVETVEVSRDTAETAYGLLRALEDGIEVQEYGSDVRARQELAELLEVTRDGDQA